MRFNLIFTIIFCAGLSLINAKPILQKFDKAAFYSIMAKGDIDAIDKEVAVLENSSLNEKDGYQGALLMKKAGLVKKAKNKLALFKEGRIKLETALIANNENIEFHFLRLAIEEHAPKVVKYRGDIEKDKLLVTRNFKDLAPAVKNAIIDYCKTSKVLHKEDL